MTTTPLKTVIFDMDGVLIDSEPTWQIAELEVFKNLGVDLIYDDLLQTTGLRIDQVVSYWYQRFPWKNYDNKEAAIAIVDKVVMHILDAGKPMGGVQQALTYCKSNNLKIGLATSSSHTIIAAVLNKLQIEHYFDSIQSAEHLSYGKPNPEVYLNYCHDLEIHASQCIAIEDSFNGLISAQAANMQTIVIPAADQQQAQKWVIARKQLHSLLELPEYLQNIIYINR